jgi:hypothetical protein
MKMSTRLYMLAEDIRDAIERAANDTKLLPGALRIDVPPVVITGAQGQRMITVRVKVTGGAWEEYRVTVERVT